MRRFRIIVINLLIVIGIIVFVSFYANRQQRDATTAAIESFESMTFAMEQVTENYLEQEQRLCDNWAALINNRHMDVNEAISTVSDSQSHRNDVVAHIIFTDDGSLEGLSTHAKSNDPNDFTVSYKNIPLVKDMSVLGKERGSVNITRAYTSPTDGVQSIAFCAAVKIADGDAMRDAVLIRVVPTATLANKWVFPTDEYENAEISLVDGTGNYIIKGKSFKNSSFFEFYKSYNPYDTSSVANLERSFTSQRGTFTMLDSKGRECLVAHSPVNLTEDWAIVALEPSSAVLSTGTDWTPVIIVSLSLLVLLVIDILVMLALNKRERQLAASAEQASKAKSRFLSNMSHEIRTPITAILGMNELIQRESDRPSVLEYSDNIQRAGNSLLHIISDILDFSKIEAGRIEIDESDYELTGLVGDVVNLTHLQAESKGLAFDVRVDPHLPSVLHGDVMRVKQVITNLLSNAVKYTERGTVTLTMELRNVSDGIATMYVSVADTGMGIREEERDRLFSAFDRLDLERNRSVQGTGLGLAISSKMLELMGSELEVESTYGEGSDFHFVLRQRVCDPSPVGSFNPFTASVAGSHRRKEGSRFFAPSARILAVDDTPMNLQVICGLLKRTEMQIDTASSGEECLSRFGENDYDLVILDYRMPDLDGIETLALMHERYPDKASATPVICLTASALSGDRERILAAGFTDYLAKPINLAKLELALMNHLPPEKVMLGVVESTDDNHVAAHQMMTDAEFDEALLTIRGRAEVHDLAGATLLVDLLGRQGLPSDRTKMLNELQKAVADEDWNEIEQAIGRIRR